VSPWLTLVIPTRLERREGLLRTLESVRRQPHAEMVEVLVVVDTHGLVDPAAHAQLREDLQSLRLRHRWLECDAGIHCYGQPQRSLGGQRALGEWIAYSQDDNILTRDALSSIWAAVCEQPHKRPLFFRIETYWGDTVWREPALMMGNIDADCLVFPRALARDVTWGLRYEGDFDAALSAMQYVQGDVDWRAETIALARPSEEAVWWSHE
jgi:hypothetical protein